MAKYEVSIKLLPVVADSVMYGDVPSDSITPAVGVVNNDPAGKISGATVVVDVGRVTVPVKVGEAVTVVP